MSEQRTEIRIALPSKGVLEQESLDLLSNAGLRVYKPNPRQYRASIPGLPGLIVLFQRPGDIVVSVRDGSVDFGITGWDIFSERRNDNADLVVLQQDLGIGACTLNVIVPEAVEKVNSMDDLISWRQKLKRPLHAASKFPVLSRDFFERHNLADTQIKSGLNIFLYVSNSLPWESEHQVNVHAVKVTVHQSCYSLAGSG